MNNRSDWGPIRAVVFDMDGLMLNTEELYQQVGGEVLRRRGKELTPDLLDQMMGRRTPTALQIMIDWHRLEDDVNTLAAESREVFSGMLDDQLQTMPGLLELLSALETAGIPKGIATSSQREFAQTVLGQYTLEPRFQFVLTAEDISQGKPHPEIYLRAAELMEVSPDEILVLEDSEIGCRAAVAAGAFSVAVPSGHSRHHDFPGAKFVAQSLADSRIYEALRLGRDGPE